MQAFKQRFRRPARRTTSRRAAAVVELAVCLPVIVLITLSTIQGASLLFLKQALVQSAYEGVKVAIRPSATNTEAMLAANLVIRSRRLENVRVNFRPRDIQKVARGEPIQVIITAPADANSPIRFGPFAGREVSTSAVMIKE
jgi:hypothetical protein